MFFCGDVYGVHSAPAPYHVQTGSRPGTPSGQSLGETREFEDQLSSAQSPTNIHHIIMYSTAHIHSCVSTVHTATPHDICTCSLERRKAMLCLVGSFRFR